MKTLSKKNIQYIVGAIEDNSSWLRILGRIFGRHVEAYAESYHDRKLRAYSDAEKHYFRFEKKINRIKINEMREDLKEEFPPRKLDGDIDDLMIERAREYDISNLIEINEHDFAMCLNHEDTNPSMYCKSNFAYCFTCNYKADPIELYMKLKDVDFKTAVKDLST